METNFKAPPRPTIQKLYDLLLGYSPVTLEFILKFLSPQSKKRSTKKELMARDLAGILGGLDKAGFEEFLAHQKPWVREAIRTGVFWEFVNYRNLEKRYKFSLGQEEGDFYESRTTLNIKIEPALSLFFPYKDGFMGLHNLFRVVFFPFFEPPPELYYEGSPAVPPASWSNETRILENFNLLIQASEAQLKRENKNVWDWMKKGLTKTQLKQLRPLCGQGEFPVGQKHGLDPIDLFFRWYISLRSVPTLENDSTPGAIKNLFSLFFNPPVKKIKLNDPLGSFFEFAVFTEHLSVKRTQDEYLQPSVPTCRKNFLQIFTECAKADRWYSVEALYQSLAMRGYRFTYSNVYSEMYSLCRRGEEIEVAEGEQIQGNYQYLIYVWGPQHHLLMDLPIFKGYWYLMALLGLVEITEKEPKTPLVNNGKTSKISVFDGLDAIRPTKLGSYCLGLTENYAMPQMGTYEAIADKDLLLVTFRGKSLERKLFLDLIGHPLGPERYRIDVRSFVRGCEDFLEVESRIERFKRLIDPEPSDRWKEFFKILKDRSEILEKNQKAVLFTVEKDRSLLADPMKNEKLRSLCYLAEGNRIVVPAQNVKKFVQLAKEEGCFFNRLDE